MDTEIEKNGVVENENIKPNTTLNVKDEGVYQIGEETDEFYYKNHVIGNIYDNPDLLK